MSMEMDLSHARHWTRVRHSFTCSIYHQQGLGECTCSAPKEVEAIEEFFRRWNWIISLVSNFTKVKSI